MAARRIVATIVAAILLAFAAMTPLAAQDRPVKIIALGDSLTAGLGLVASDAFPAKLAVALKAQGIDVTIVNAGVSGDTATGGLERLDWAVSSDVDAVIVELGSNDMLRGIDPKITRAALAAIVQRLRQRHIAVLVCGMLAAPNLGRDYAQAFNQLYPDIAAAYGALYYPFFLEGVATVRQLNQADGMHPTAEGVDVVVKQILPTVEQLVIWAKRERSS